MAELLDSCRFSRKSQLETKGLMVLRSLVEKSYREAVRLNRSLAYGPKYLVLTTYLYPG